MTRPDNKRANKWLARILDSNHILWMIFLLSLLESIILPVPLELVLIPLLLHKRERWFVIATVTLTGCLVGATIGYSIGVFFFDTAGQWLIQWFGFTSEFSEFQQDFDEHGFSTLLLVGITPVPFQIGMLAAGSANYPFLFFFLASLIARGIRYYGLALLVNWFGERFLNWWQAHRQRFGWSLLVVGLAIYLAVVLS
ncbi:YqaA family protein [Pseudidiomarina sp. E22-M8]|uniref:YqaA family protein n=1 Tax=Pseudidiomarina sp. E22-M8 TaxID=3424768 RepID=UPI00403D1F3E